MDEQNAPLFRQIAALIEDLILEGRLAEGQRAPSMNELAEFHRINPATARRGLVLLAGQGILEKGRGVGMFVANSAGDLIRERRHREIAADYVAPLVDEAVKLDLSRADLHELLEKVASSRGLYR